MQAKSACMGHPEFFPIFKLLILEELCRNSLHLFDKAGFRYYPCENKSLTQERAQRTQENRKQREYRSVKRTKGAPIERPLLILMVANWRGSMSHWK
jgi:hypothetical protein